MPLVIACLWLAVRLHETGRLRYLVGAGLCGLLAVLSHVILVVPCLGVATAYVAAHDTRRRLARGAIVAAVTTLPVWIALAVSGASASRASSIKLGYDSPSAFGNRLKLQLALFDRGAGRAFMTVALLTAALVALYPLFRRLTHHPSEDDCTCARRVVAFTLLSWVLAYILVPVAATIGGVSAWGVNFRYFVFLIAALLALVRSPPPRATRIAAGVAFSTATVSYVVVMIAFFGRFDAYTRNTRPVFDMIPAGSAFKVMNLRGRFERAWPSVARHVHAWRVARAGGFDTAVFAGGHIPIRPSANAPIGNDKLRCVAPFSYLVTHLESNTAPPAVPDGQLITQVEDWALYAKVVGVACP